MFTIQCTPTASNKWYPREETKLEVRDSPTLHAWASSEDSSEECLEIEATAAARYTKRPRETACGATPKANQQAPNTQEVHGNPLRRKSMIFKLNSEFKEPHKMQCLKIKEE